MFQPQAKWYFHSLFVLFRAHSGNSPLTRIMVHQKGEMVHSESMRAKVAKHLEQGAWKQIIPLVIVLKLYLRHLGYTGAETLLFMKSQR